MMSRAARESKPPEKFNACAVPGSRLRSVPGACSTRAPVIFSMAALSRGPIGRSIWTSSNTSPHRPAYTAAMRSGAGVKA